MAAALPQPTLHPSADTAPGGFGAGWARLSVAGGVCMLLGIGLARLAYTPLIPALVDARWFTVVQADYLGAVNLLGYLAGAAIAHRATQTLGARRMLALNLALTVASLYACMLDWGTLWYGLWRFACGASGAVLTVLGASQALARIAPRHRPAASALIFSGIGLGITASGTLVPWLIRWGVVATWLALGLLATALALWAWMAVWSRLPETPHPPAAATPRPDAPWPRAAVAIVIVGYGLDAVGFVPHSIFWVDYIAHELGQGLVAGGAYWAGFGLGAAVGPMVAGLAARRLGFRPALTLGIAVMSAAVALPLASSAPLALWTSSALVGLSIPEVVALTSGAIVELIPAGREQQAWAWATLSFALLQAIAGYGMSWIYALAHSYQPLFAIAALALLIAALGTLATVRVKAPAALAESHARAP
jgi:predicted MFS family arabinose efflux permease